MRSTPLKYLALSGLLFAFTPATADTAKIQTYVNLFSTTCVPFVHGGPLKIMRGVERVQSAPGLYFWFHRDTGMLVDIVDGACHVTDTRRPIAPQNHHKLEAAVARVIATHFPDLQRLPDTDKAGLDMLELWSDPNQDSGASVEISFYRYEKSGVDSGTTLTLTRP